MTVSTPLPRRQLSHLGRVLRGPPPVPQQLHDSKRRTRFDEVGGSVAGMRLWPIRLILDLSDVDTSPYKPLSGSGNEM